MQKFSHIPSFVRRAGRLNDKQRQALDTLLPDYIMPPLDIPWNLAKLFANKSVVIEIGFGMGASLLQMAIENPKIQYIGVDIHKPGIANLALQIKARNILNLRIAPYDAVLIFNNLLESNSVIDGIQIFFPDPWPKARHHKRRLIQAPWVAKIINTLKPGAFIHCATDDKDYALQMLEIFSATAKLKNSDANNGFLTRPSTRPLTKFEQRGLNLNHEVFDLMFTKLA